LHRRAEVFRGRISSSSSGDATPRGNIPGENGGRPAERVHAFRAQQSLLAQGRSGLTLPLPSGFAKLRRPGDPGPEQRRIYEALGVDWRNLPKSTVVVPGKKQPETL